MKTRGMQMMTARPALEKRAGGRALACHGRVLPAW